MKKTILTGLVLIVAAAFMLCAAAFAQEQERRPPGISDSEFQSALNDIKASEPDFYQSLADVKRDNEGIYREIVTGWAMRQRDLEEMKKHDPKQYEKQKAVADLEKQERNLSAKYRLSKDKNERAMILQQLKSVLPQLFDKRLEMQRREVTELENRIKEVKEDIARRESNKDRIIERHLNELVGVDEDLQW